jgi:hypothetical protein
MPLMPCRVVRSVLCCVVCGGMVVLFMPCKVQKGKDKRDELRAGRRGGEDRRGEEGRTGDVS